MNDEKNKMLRLMKFWLFGTFVIIFAASTIYVASVFGTGLLIFRELNYWLAMIGAAVLCVIWFYVYKYLIEKR